VKLYDYHTHNGYSGCASKAPYSVLEGWKTIQSRGVTKWGISNHYPTRSVYGDYFPALRSEIDAMHNNNILLGVELEMNSEEGKCALTPQQLELLDYVIGSVHNLPHNFLSLPNVDEEEIAEFFGSFRNMLVNGLERIPVRIWGHPFMNEFNEWGDAYWKEHLLPIYEKCLDIIERRQIAIDINPSYAGKCKKFPTVEQVLDEMFTLAIDRPGVYFVTSSDAHSLANLGDLTIPLRFMEKYHISSNRILEIDKKSV
jgi:histidinol phosphatase-like PHP family hydrolase